jgi:hypothetical protein
MIANRQYREYKSDNIKDGAQLMIKIGSCIFILMVKVFEMPFIAALMTGFMCSENKDLNIYAISDI